jgi:hypothetical protein
MPVEGHGKWKRDDADTDTGKQIVQKGLTGIRAEGKKCLGEVWVAEGH